MSTTSILTSQKTTTEHPPVATTTGVVVAGKAPRLDTNHTRLTHVTIVITTNVILMRYQSSLYHPPQPPSPLPPSPPLSLRGKNSSFRRTPTPRSTLNAILMCRSTLKVVSVSELMTTKERQPPAFMETTGSGDYIWFYQKLMHRSTSCQQKLLLHLPS